jgi:hypothetical protein
VWDILELYLPYRSKFRVQFFDVLADNIRDANIAGWTDGLEARGDVHAVAEEVFIVRDSVADVHSHSETDAPVTWHTAIKFWHTGLYLDCEANSRDYARKHHHQRVAGGVHDSSAITSEGGINKALAQRCQAGEGVSVVLADQAAEANHVGMDVCH